MNNDEIIKIAKTVRMGADASFFFENFQLKRKYS